MKINVFEKIALLWKNLWDDEEEVLYIGGTDVLPAPLVQEEETMCLNALMMDTKTQKGIASGEYMLTKEEVREKLISHDLRLVE